MSTSTTDCRSRKSPQFDSRQRQKPPELCRLEGRSVEADVNGGAIISGADLLLVKQVDRQFGITEKFARCFEDRGTFQNRVTFWVTHHMLKALLNKTL
ncbi:MAG: hypothetical protein AAGC93_26800 [Cyanobacteria bacterium P01_F01_bin.53]